MIDIIRRKLNTDYHLKHNQLSKEIGFNQSTISRIASGATANPQIDICQALLDRFAADELAAKSRDRRKQKDRRADAQEQQ